MRSHIIPLYGLLVLGIVAFPVHANGMADDCVGALHHEFATANDTVDTSAHATLPDACTHLGPLALGMTRSQVLAAMGAPDKERTAKDHPGTADLLYVYPRDLNAQLARKPVTADQIAYSQLRVRIQQDKVTAISTFANAKAPLPFALLGQPAGTKIDGLMAALGGHPQWNASRDYVQFPSVPFALSVDPDTAGLVGVDIADRMTSLATFSGQGLNLTKDKASGLVNGFH
ncbi:secreted signal peptide protein [Luteibacter sp. ME-Dv--P-043b]|uniref:secreted signal peptide protein n=1 Tax=Lysobacterales TaxID=135614 RepID=UPI0025575DF8|nr:secreted signal peptide protein [Luteibacter sp. ME-Dv--P-043b]